MLQAVCQMVMNGDTAFETTLLQLKEAEGSNEMASTILSMWCLDLTGMLLAHLDSTHLQSECSDWLPAALSLHQECPRLNIVYKP